MKEQAGQEAFRKEELCSAAHEVRESLLSALPPPSACQHEFSQGFCEKMEALLSRAQRRQTRRRVLQRAAAVFLAFVVGSGIWLTVDADAREAFIAWVREVYEDCIVYRFSGSDARRTDGLPHYAPTWLPDGYSEVRVHEGEYASTVLYRKGGDVKNDIVFEYHLNAPGINWSIYLLPESDAYNYESLEINGLPADLYICTDGSETNNLIWMSADQHVVFELNAFLSREDMLHIAESVVLVDTTE